MATRKAAIWSALGGLAIFGSTEFSLGFYPYPYLTLSAMGFGLMLPVIASLHIRHAPVRQSGAVLGTIAGASVAVLGLVSAQAPGFVVSTVFVAGLWWWTIGKMWLETALLPRIFGAITMALGVACFAGVLGFALVGTTVAQAIPLEIAKILTQTVLALVLGPWLVVLAPLLWRSAR